MNLATFILVSVPLAVQYWAEKYRVDDYKQMLTEIQPQFSVPAIETYDFIIVGGGSAGCVVAGRLSEHFNVLLLEAGGSPVPATEVPGFVAVVGFEPVINYFFTPVPQQNAGQEWDGVLETSFGKMLGGSGSHNDMVHNRGNPRDFDNWANLTGDPSWAYESVLPYFKKYENFTGVLFDEGDEAAYGHDGPLQINTYMNPMIPIWFEAARELGYDVADPNGHQREGFTALHVMIAGGKRGSSYKGFVAPYEESRANLTVLRYSDVEEVLIENDAETGEPRAVGVQFNRHGVIQRALASREVILSAGSVRSPLLLMKSGVGPADVLAEAEIPVKVERSGVGRNLGEHVATLVGPIYINDSSILPRIRDGPEGEAELERWHTTGEGVLGEMGEGPQAFFVSSRAKAEGQEGWPDIQIALSLRVGFAPAPEGEQESIQLFVVNGRSRQRGNLRLNGTAWKEGERDDQNLAVIDLDLFNDPSDVDVLIEAIKLGLNVLENTTTYQRLGATYPAVPIPSCAHLEYRSDEYWRCYILYRGYNWNHFVGTNSMGRADNPDSVVDSKLKVIGVKGLRVVDCSVMPVLPNANTNAPVLMVAEKAAAEILSEHLPNINIKL